MAHLISPVEIDSSFYCVKHGNGSNWRTESILDTDVTLNTTENSDSWEPYPSADNSAAASNREIKFGVMCISSFSLELLHDLDTINDRITVTVYQNDVQIAEVKNAWQDGFEDVRARLAAGTGRTATVTLDPELGACGAVIRLSTDFVTYGSGTTWARLTITSVA